MRRVVHAGTAPRRRSKIKLEEIHVLVLPDDDPDTSYLEQDEFEDRLAQYRNGDFTFVGVRVVADVEIDGLIQTLESGGLWGIESDSGEDYLKGIAHEEWSQLRATLLTIGVPSKQLPQKLNQRLEWRM